MVAITELVGLPSGRQSPMLARMRPFLLSFAALPLVVRAAAAAPTAADAHAELNVDVDAVTLRLSAGADATTFPAAECGVVQATVRDWRRAHLPRGLLVLHVAGEAPYRTVACALGGWGAGGDPTDGVRIDAVGGLQVVSGLSEFPFLTVGPESGSTFIVGSLSEVVPVDIPDVAGMVDTETVTARLAAELAKHRFDLQVVGELDTPWARLADVLDATCAAMAGAHGSGSHACRVTLAYAQRAGDPGLPKL